MTRVRQRKFAEAKLLSQQAIALEPDHYLTHYYYAYALSREGMDAEQTINRYDPARAQLMRAELSRAIALKPGFPESYRLLAFINLVTGEQLEEAVNLLTRALCARSRTPRLQVDTRAGSVTEKRFTCCPQHPDATRQQRRELPYPRPRPINARWNQGGRNISLKISTRSA
jgi:tetratricopeptide (TPR) repeat protein